MATEPRHIRPQRLKDYLSTRVVLNNSGSKITKGMVVRVTGINTADAYFLVTAALADAGESGPLYTAEEDIEDTLAGRVRKTAVLTLDTLAGAQTDPVYLSASVAGSISLTSSDEQIGWVGTVAAAGVCIIDPGSLGTDTAHATSDGSSHADVVTNTTHSTGDGSDHADVATNTAALEDLAPGANHYILKHTFYGVYTSTTASGAPIYPEDPIWAVTAAVDQAPSTTATGTTKLLTKSDFDNDYAVLLPINGPWASTSLVGPTTTILQQIFQPTNATVRIEVGARETPTALDSTTDSNAAFFVYDTDTDSFWRFLSNSAGAGYVTTVTAITPLAAVDFKIVYSDDGLTVKGYINGALVATHTTTANEYGSPYYAVQNISGAGLTRSIEVSGITLLRKRT